MISVLIATINDPHLAKTIEEIRKTADGEVEFISINDGGTPLIADGIIINNPQVLGRRVSFNNAAKIARGDHLLIVDPHCSMSEHWDAKMMKSCGDKNLVFSVLRDMDEKFVLRPGGPYLHVSMNREYTEKWWPKKTLEECAVEEESMCFTGCGWMIKKDRFWELGGYEESLGKYGWDGPEWSCKTWMSDNPGKVILRTDIVCGHIFGTNLKAKLYRCEMISKPQYLTYMKNKWGNKINSLVKRFAPVPDWDETERSIMSQGTEREVKLQRQKESVTKNEKGEIIKKVIEYFEYIHIDDGNGPTEDVILEQHKDDLKKVSEEIWILKDGQLQKVA